MSNYVAGQNAHIDTKEFEDKLEMLSEGAEGDELYDMDFQEIAYRELLKILNQPPRPVSSDTVICRYLTPEKFLWFLGSKAIYFGRVGAFDDAHDCGVPEDYHLAVSKFYALKKADFEAFEYYVDDIRHEWLISCWTEISDKVDDYLLWHRYAEGPLGVGITIQYGQLHEAIHEGLRNKTEESRIENVMSGYVEYGGPLKATPFNKRRMFRNEREVRFVAQSEWLPHVSLSISDIFSSFGLRFSPDVPKHHMSVIVDVWQKYGGSDDIVVSNH